MFSCYAPLLLLLTATRSTTSVPFFDLDVTAVSCPGSRVSRCARCRPDRWPWQRDVSVKVPLRIRCEYRGQLFAAGVRIMVCLRTAWNFPIGGGGDLFIVKAKKIPAVHGYLNPAMSLLPHVKGSPLWFLHIPVKNAASLSIPPPLLYCVNPRVNIQTSGGKKKSSTSNIWLIFTPLHLIGNRHWRASVNPGTSSPGSCAEPSEGNNAASLPAGNLDPPPCPPTWPVWWLSRRGGCIKEVNSQMKFGSDFFICKEIPIVSKSADCATWFIFLNKWNKLIIYCSCHHFNVLDTSTVDSCCFTKLVKNKYFKIPCLCMCGCI